MPTGDGNNYRTRCTLEHQSTHWCLNSLNTRKGKTLHSNEEKSVRNSRVSTKWDKEKGWSRDPPWEPTQGPEHPQHSLLYSCFWKGMIGLHSSSPSEARVRAAQPPVFVSHISNEGGFLALPHTSPFWSVSFFLSLNTKHEQSPRKPHLKPFQTSEMQNITDES